MADLDIAIGDTFEHISEPGRAWEVTRLLDDGRILRLEAGQNMRLVTPSQLPGQYVRCEARATFDPPRLVIPRGDDSTNFVPFFEEAIG